MEKKVVRAIKFEMRLKGQGIVNFDSSDQKYILNKYCGMRISNDNNKLSKKAFFDDGEDENGNPRYTYKVKIANSCLRHAIFEDDLCVNSPLMIKHMPLLKKFMLSNIGIGRGYMFTLPKRSGDTDKDGGEDGSDAKKNNGLSLKKDSALVIVDAVQDNDSVVYNEVGSVSGFKTDNTFFCKDSVTEMSYKTSGVICLNKMEFLSGDPIFDRMAYVSDENANDTFLKEYEEERRKSGVSTDEPDFKEGYYTNMNNVFGNTFPEKGIYVSDSKMMEIIRYLLRRLLNLKIYRTSGYVENVEMRIKLISDLNDQLNGEWLTITNEDDIKRLDFIPRRTYFEVDESEGIRHHEEYMARYDSEMSNCKEKKKNNATKKKKAKTEE